MTLLARDKKIPSTSDISFRRMDMRPGAVTRESGSESEGMCRGWAGLGCTGKGNLEA